LFWISIYITTILIVGLTLYLFKLFFSRQKNIIRVKPQQQDDANNNDNKMTSGGGEHFFVEIEIKYGKQSYEDFWFHWKKDMGIQSAKEDGSIQYLFKTSGENKIVLVAKTDGDCLDNLLYCRIHVIRKFADQIDISVTPIYAYETFANIANNLIASETRYDKIPSVVKESGKYHLLNIRMEHSSIPYDKFMKIWTDEIAAALTAKQAGIAVNIWKCLAQRRVFVITNIDELPALDTIVLTLPMMKAMGDQMYITAKRLTTFDKFVEQFK
jgi:hypothetical protein